MPDSIDISVGGHTMLACSERALFWPARTRLLLSDLHLGKADQFRQTGFALPSGGTALDLTRLSQLAARTGATDVWVLGDFLHGAISSPTWRKAWEEWRGLNRSLRISVLSGNHDRALARAGLEVELLGDAVDEDGIAFRHSPTSLPDLHVICGHLHPVVALPSLRGRWPIFWLRRTMTILPAYSEFSGGYLVAPASDEEFVACVHGEVAFSGKARIKI